VVVSRSSIAKRSFPERGRTNEGFCASSGGGGGGARVGQGGIENGGSVRGGGGTQ